MSHHQLRVTGEVERGVLYPQSISEQTGDVRTTLLPRATDSLIDSNDRGQSRKEGLCVGSERQSIDRSGRGKRKQKGGDGYSGLDKNKQGFPESKEENGLSFGNAMFVWWCMCIQCTTHSDES